MDIIKGHTYTYKNIFCYLVVKGDISYYVISDNINSIVDYVMNNNKNNILIFTSPHKLYTGFCFADYPYIMPEQQFDINNASIYDWLGYKPKDNIITGNVILQYLIYLFIDSNHTFEKNIRHFDWKIYKEQ